MKEFIQRTVCPDATNAAYVKTTYGGKNHCILGNEDGRTYKGSVLPNCTGYVHGRSIEVNGTDENLCLGNAENYWNYKDGLERGQYPRAGAIAVWRKGKAGNAGDGAGHVEFVETCNSHGDFTSTGSAWSGTKENGRYWRRRTFKRVNGTYALGVNYYFLGFIYTTTFNPIPIIQQAVYRLYNPNGDQHVFTLNHGEATSLARAGWTYEGVGWKAPKTGTPVYRLYNPNDGDHLMTRSSVERNEVAANGWEYEGTAFYSDDESGEPIYRLYNENGEEHFYTANKGEYDELVKLGWDGEGIAFYACKGESK